MHGKKISISNTNTAMLKAKKLKAHNNSFNHRKNILKGHIKQFIKSN